MINEEEKTWGSREFWGVNSMFDPQWVLTNEQKVIQKNLIELCRTTLRPNAVRCDETYEFPRENLNALASQGLLGLVVPKKFGGLGQNQICAAMVTETISRYGCPSTATIYVMHLGAVCCLAGRYHRNKHIQELLKRLDKDKMVGTQAFSDGATGGHFWYLLSSKCWELADGSFQIQKFGSWATSAGFADFYVLPTVSPESRGDYQDMTMFLVYKDEVRANTEDWSALGMRGNQSGPMVAEGVLTRDRVVGEIGEGKLALFEFIDPVCTLLFAADFNGISMGAIDIARKHTMSRTHADTGMRVCDYPIIQDKIGQAMCDTSASRLMVIAIAQELDRVTDNFDWSKYEDPTYQPMCVITSIISNLPSFFHTGTHYTPGWREATRSEGDCLCTAVSGEKNNVFMTSYGFNPDWMLEHAGYRTAISHWPTQAKVISCKNVYKIVDKMLQACGGSGYKTELGLERLLRDGKAGWIMGPSNEVKVQVIASYVLYGVDNFDYWNKLPNPRVVRQEVKKMTGEQKTELAKHLLWEVDAEKVAVGQTDAAKLDFDNPLAVRKPNVAEITKPALQADVPSCFTLKEKCILTKDERMAVYTFAMPPGTSHTGCLPGQYIQIVIPENGRESVRFLSPTSTPDSDGELEIVLRRENLGVLATFMKQLDIGSTAQFRGPCGGFEYTPNTFDSLTFVCGGIGITPAYQIIRSISKNPDDKTKVLLLYQAKDSNDMIFKNEIEDMCSSRADQQIRAEFIVNDPDESWDGPVGDVDSVLLHKYFKTLPPETIRHVFVLCGGAYMAVRCLDVLHQLHAKSEDIFVYGPFAAEQIRAMFGRSVKLFSQ